MLGMLIRQATSQARSRHEFARNLLARGLDPAALKVALGKRAFAVAMREWQAAAGSCSTYQLRY